MYIHTSESLLILFILFIFLQDALVQNDKNGLRGFKKQLSGRFKRLVTRKYQDNNAPTIPPELKPQLKQIYVY